MAEHHFLAHYLRGESILKKIPCFSFFLLLAFGCDDHTGIALQRHDRIVIVGSNMASRMMDFGHFETELHLRHPEDSLFIRNMADGGNTPGFWPHSGRKTPWAFEGADAFHKGELSNDTNSQGHFDYPDEWLSRLKPDIVLAFFGYNSSFNGKVGLENFRAELQAYVRHILSKKYNGANSPKLVLVSPNAFQDLSKILDVPDGSIENDRLFEYCNAMREVARANNVVFIDVFAESKKWYKKGEPLTIDGVQLNDKGYQRLAKYLADEIFGKQRPEMIHADLVLQAVDEKNWMWHNDYKIPNGVHVYGRRYKPYGPDNYPDELKKIREMTAIRDTAIWEALQGHKRNLSKYDGLTHQLPEVKTNYTLGNGAKGAQYLYGEDAVATIRTATGYKVELFASEKEFPDLANPVQMSFDNKGRLWVATMPSYPHYRPGDSKPNDKIIILEDTDEDGKADTQTVFADGLHVPVGFEITANGVFVSQATHLKHFKDTDGDDRADEVEIVLSGFDDHDTHHTISAFCADPSGAIYMGEGVFLHTNVETPYGPVRGSNGGFYRYDPARKRLERTAQIAIPNPWGIAFDDYGQYFFAETSGPAVRWLMPSTVKPVYGRASPKARDLIEEEHKVRPTSGLEFISSRHFPDEVQGDLLINNTIGFLGMKQHQIIDSGTGYEGKHRQDLIWSDDGNFRPVDMEFAPDGSLYFIDWHNILIGHMQHNARDPLRDHSHGRVYRVTYPSRPLLEPAVVDGASIERLLDNLKLHEYRTRYRTRRELRSRNVGEVLTALKKWIGNLDKEDKKYELHLLEALWVSWGANSIDHGLLKQCLNADNYKVRAAAVIVLRYMGHQVDDSLELLKKAAQDPHGRVRLTAVVAASWLPEKDAFEVLDIVDKNTLDEWSVPTLDFVLNRGKDEKEKEEESSTDLTGSDLELYQKGKEIYSREGFCITCHQENGKGLKQSGFPPLSQTQWVTGSEGRLIKIALNGLYGAIEVNGEKYPGQVPMTAYGDMLGDEEIAAVLTYVRNSFGNKASVITADKVNKTRLMTQEKKGFYTPKELLEIHPLEE
ncbi:PVC-type heme-binding CxxCH protein [Allomuricauda sp. SCSIO 65647]|uniref:PVC-type heme-binding CxxCH protein n=1 Tax=Allomuricauda sp. SCSIO 65647 TaxID=2908843 RepID=UPI001F2FF42B|nr:PVC-type heme-binding CxxCH protein [Muricauda sp. SCSIO 65647]UJH66287.1 HEAT repeat domain-containing protein [Muricauda sp. SCSIO 65647]